MSTTVRHLSGVRISVMGALIAGVILLATPAIAQEREHRSVESGRVESVSATPLSLTIDGRVFSVTDETHLRGRALSGEPAVIASTLRTVVGSEVGYDWYQDPGQRPVLVTIVPIRMER